MKNTKKKELVATMLAIPASCCILTSTAVGQISFGTGSSTVVGSEPSDVATGDWDGDGDQDLATTVDNPDRVVLLMNDGTGTFSIGASPLLPNSSSPGEVVAGDFDGDGDMDLAIALKDNSTIQIMINTAGVFSLGATATTQDEPRELGVGDHDQDGDLDLIVSNRESNSITIMTNTGAASFTSVHLAAGSDTRGAALLDIDGDGDLDAAASSQDTREVLLFTNTGGVFSSGGSVSVGIQRRPEGLASADLNGDGFDEIIAASSGNGFNSATVFMNLAGTFAAPIHYATGGVDPSNVSAADLDCDGDLDIAVVNTDSNNVSMFANDGAGTFGAAVIVAVGGDPQPAEFADFDGNGSNDIAIASSMTNDVFIAMNTCTVDSAKPGDTNADDLVNLTDLLNVLSSWGPCSGCGSDLNSDGMTGLPDLLEVLSNWGT